MPLRSSLCYPGAFCKVPMELDEKGVEGLEKDDALFVAEAALGVGKQ
jgi:hypothetical protein